MTQLTENLTVWEL